MFRSPLWQVCRRFALHVGEGVGQLGNNVTQIADKRHIYGSVDTDSGWIALDIDPFAFAIAVLPMPASAIVQGFLCFRPEGLPAMRLSDNMLPYYQHVIVQLANFRHLCQPLLPHCGEDFIGLYHLLLLLL